jgi:hypothetical protein
MAGYFLWSPGSLLPNGLAAFRGNLAAAVLWTAAIVLGASLWARWLATMVRGPWTRLAAVIGAGLLLTTGLSVSIVVLYRGQDVAVDRFLLVTGGGSWWWQWSPAVVFGCALILVVAAKSTVDWWTAGLAAVAAGVAAIAVARRPHAAGLDAAYLLLAQRWWICALAGAIAVVGAFLLARVTPTSALVTGGLAAVLAGAGQFAWDASRDRTALQLHNLLVFLRFPVWLVLAVAVVAAPLMVLLAQVMPRRPLRLPVRLAVMVPVLVAADLALAGGFLAPLTVAGGDYDHIRAVTAAVASPTRPVAAAPTPVVTPGSRAGRAVDAATAGSALDSVGGALPAGWVSVPDDKGTNRAIEPQSCVDLFDRDMAADAARAHTADEERSYKLPDTLQPPTGVQLVVGITSYQTPALAADAYGAIAGETRMCPQWTDRVSGPDDGLLHITFAADTPPSLPYPTLALILTGTFVSRGQPGVEAVAVIHIDAGNNEIFVNVSEVYLGSVTMPADRVTNIRTIALTTVAAVLASLST